MIVGDLFSGIGGFSLAAHWMGWRTAWFCEIEPYPSRVLERHWPGVPNHGDITQVDFTTVEPVDLLCGGFPCQDISNAGKREGIRGERSGLWSHFARAIRELRPRYVVVENVSALLTRGIDVVLGDLATLGYDAEWTVLSAADIGAPHLRQRVWIVAYPQHDRVADDGSGAVAGEASGVQGPPWRERLRLDTGERHHASPGGPLADTNGSGRHGEPEHEGEGPPGRGRTGEGGEALADAERSRRGGSEGSGVCPDGPPLAGEPSRPRERSGTVADANSSRLGESQERDQGSEGGAGWNSAGSGGDSAVSDTDRAGRRVQRLEERAELESTPAGEPDGRGCEGSGSSSRGAAESVGGRVLDPMASRGEMADAGGEGLPLTERSGWSEPGEAEGGGSQQWGAAAERGWWAVEPDVGRVANGVPARVDRLKGLGNAIVPQCAAVIFQAIAQREAGGD